MSDKMSEQELNDELDNLTKLELKDVVIALGDKLAEATDTEDAPAYQGTSIGFMSYS